MLFLIPFHLVVLFDFIRDLQGLLILFVIYLMVYGNVITVIRSTFLEKPLMQLVKLLKALK